MSSHLLLYRKDGALFDLPVASGLAFGSTSQMGKWDSDWTHIRGFGNSDQPYLLLYKQSTGKTFTMPVHNAAEFGVATPCGTWETDWAQITPFSVGGKDFMLLYRTSGTAFYLPVHPGPSFGSPISMGSWEADWAHIEYFNVSGQAFFLLVRQNGAAFAARIHYGLRGVGEGRPGVPPHAGPGVFIDSPVPLGRWETDWTKIRAFAVQDSPHLLFYRTSGEVFTAPIELPGGPFTPREELTPVVGTTTSRGTWETDWAEIAGYQLADFTFGIDRLDVINQKADTDHADNDWLSLVWTITRAGTKEVIPFSKTIPIPGALFSGQSVSGPFSTDPFKLAAGDILTITAIVTNFGSSDTNQQFSQAAQLTKKVVDDLIPVVTIIVGAILGVGPIGGFQKGKEITDAFDWALQGLTDLADSLGLHIGPPNCNGVVLSTSWVYNASDFPAVVGLAGSEPVDGPSKSGCGTSPSTRVSWSIRRT